MKVFTPHPKQRRGTHTIVVTPGHKNPETAFFMTTNDKNEKVPKPFNVSFVNGEADVEDALGKWMLANGHAVKSKRLIKLLGED